MINLENIYPDSFTLIEYLEKGRKPAAIGEIRQWGNRKYQKTSEGWVELKSGYTIDPNFNPLKSTTQRWLDKDGSWKKQRVEKVHKPIIDSYLEDKRVVSKKHPTVYLMMGAPASGKGSVRRSFEGKYVEVDPDDIKMKGLKDDFNRYYRYNAELAAAKIHEEGSYLSKEIINKLIEKKTDFLVDRTYTNWNKLKASIKMFEKAGYNIEVHLAWCPKKEAEKRKNDRFKRTKRNVPKGYFDRCHNEVLDTFELLKKNFPNIKRIRKINTLTNKVEYDSAEKES